MFLSVLIPIYNLDFERKRNLEFIYNRLISHYNESEIEIILGIQDPIIDEYYHRFDRAILRNYNYNNQDFNKSYIFNKCIEDGINGEFLLFLDADIYFPFKKLRSQLNRNHSVIRPFYQCIYLDDKTTESFLYKGNAVADKDSKRLSATGGGCIILNKNILSDIKMDENFYGWGWEDIDLGNQLSKKYEIYILYQDAVHLYHDPCQANQNNYTYYNNKYKYSHKPYNKTLKSDIEIILTYFSPCNYQKPKKNTYKCIESLASTNTPITLVEVVLPGADPLVLSKDINHIQFPGDEYNILFLKENLFNIGIKHTNNKKILFLDSDILFDDIDFITKSSEMLDEYDVIQPFEHCLWMCEDRTPLLDHNFSQSVVKPMSLNHYINGYKHHPGFAWGATRDFMTASGGFYDQAVLGAGDFLFAYAIANNDDLFRHYQNYLLNTNQTEVYTKEYIQYKNTIKNYKPLIGYLKNCTCYHMYHGSRANREYQNRNKKYLSCNIKDNKPDIYYDNNGLLKWRDIESAKKLLEYFKNRKEDD